jgi:DNA polymerase-3 subunit beta
MFVTLRKEDIVDGLLQATAITPSRTGAAYLRTVWLQAEEGKLTVSATDSSLEFCGTYPAEVQRAGTLGAQGKFLADLVRKLPPGPLTIKSSPEEMVLHVTQGPRSYKLAVSDPAWFQPMRPFPQGQAAQMEGRQLRLILDRVLFCVADDESLGSMTCLKMTPSEDIVEFCGLDGLKLALHREVNTDLAHALGRDALLPKKYAQDLRKWIPDAPLEIARQDDRLFVRTLGGSETMSLPLRDLAFFDYQKLLRSMESRYVGQITVGREELADALDRIAIFTTESQYVAQFAVQGTDLILSTPTQETGTGEEALPCHAEGQITPFCLAARSVLDVTSRFDAPQLTIHFADSRSLVRITTNDDANYSVSMMPVAMEEESYYE